MSDDTSQTERCPLTVDWIRGRADIEVRQLILLEVPTRLAPPEIVVQAPSSTLALADSPAGSMGEETETQ